MPAIMPGTYGRGQCVGAFNQPRPQVRMVVSGSSGSLAEGFVRIRLAGIL